MRNGIEFKVVWSDQGVSKFLVSCSNARFCGVASFYLKRDDLARMAQVLSGFPAHAGDARDFELGAFDVDYAESGMRMRFHCQDSVGHAAVDVKLRGDTCVAMGEVESVALRIPVEAAAVDSFVAQLRGMHTNEIDATACLRTGS